MVWALSSLNDNELKNIKSLEEKLGLNILAFSKYDVKTAEISEREVEEIKKLEENLGLSLVATERQK